MKFRLNGKTAKGYRKDLLLGARPPNKIKKVQPTGFCKEINKLGEALSSPPRYQILEALRESPKMSGELTKATGISHPAVSHHLKALKACNLVLDTKQGKAVVYHLNAGHMLNLLNALTKTLKK